MMNLLWILALIVATPFLIAVGSGNNDMAVLSTVVLFIVLPTLYFAPTIIAARAGHASSAGIFALNLFLGLTAVGWVIALIWALQPPRQGVA